MTDELDKACRDAAHRHRTRRLGLYLDAILADLIEHHGVNKTRKLLLEYADHLKEFDSGNS